MNLWSTYGLHPLQSYTTLRIWRYDWNNLHVIVKCVALKKSGSCVVRGYHVCKDEWDPSQKLYNHHWMFFHWMANFLSGTNSMVSSIQNNVVLSGSPHWLLDRLLVTFCGSEGSSNVFSGWSSLSGDTVSLWLGTRTCDFHSNNLGPAKLILQLKGAYNWLACHWGGDYIRNFTVCPNLYNGS